jgi:hypothetical protein
MTALNSRLAGLNFSRFCGNVYKAEELCTLKSANPNLVQLNEDSDALENLNEDCNQHDENYWGDEGRFTRLGQMYLGMANLLGGTRREFLSRPNFKVPEQLICRPDEDASNAGQQDNQSAYCSNPLEGDDFCGSHGKLVAAFDAASKQITPAHSCGESFNHYYQGKDWGARWRGFVKKYAGEGATDGEYPAILHQLQANQEKIQFGQGCVLEKRSLWIPGRANFSSVLPWASFYKDGWNSFMSSCHDIWHSDILKPTMPTWSSEFFDQARANLADSIDFKLIPFFMDFGRPKVEDWITKATTHSATIYDGCITTLMNGVKHVGRAFLKWLVSPVAWIAKVVGTVTLDFFIGLANVLYNAGVGVLWGSTWLGQVVLKAANTVWQAAKFFPFYPISKIVGLVACPLAYAALATGYALVATGLWAAKSLCQFARLITQNFAIVAWNILGRPIAWVGLHTAAALWSAARFTWTSVKAFLHVIYTAGANVCSYLGGWAHYHVLKPIAIFIAKVALRFAQVIGHVALGLAQVVYCGAKIAWHFVLHPVVKGAKWLGKNFVKLLKLIWKVVLPVLYCMVWVPAKFLVVKALLFVAAALQLVFYSATLILGGLALGTAYVLSEAGLKLKSHWISKSFYPIPYSTWRRQREFDYLNGRAPLLDIRERDDVAFA